jgi:hypothetical protein
MILYRGLSKTRGDDIIANREQFAATSNGEFGAGTYYWKVEEGDHALYASIVSALKYYGETVGGWAVIKLEWDDNSAAYKQFLENNYTLDFRYSKTQTVKYTSDLSGEQGPRSMATLHGIDLTEFNRLNENPAEVKSNAESKKIPWMHYPMILGPTVAAPLNTNLTQIKFNGAGVTLLNDGATVAKTLVVTGNSYAGQNNAANIKTRIESISLNGIRQGVRTSFARIAQAIDGGAVPAAAGNFW